MPWIDACAADDIAEEDVIRWGHGAHTYAIYRSPDDRYYCTDGLCTHMQVHLAVGLVMGDIIQCLKHNGHFNYRDGSAVRIPARRGLVTYPVKVEGGRVLVELA